MLSWYLSLHGARAKLSRYLFFAALKDISANACRKSTPGHLAVQKHSLMYGIQLYSCCLQSAHTSSATSA
jgi:hypothetical protein